MDAKSPLYRRLPELPACRASARASRGGGASAGVCAGMPGLA